MDEKNGIGHLGLGGKGVRVRERLIGQGNRIGLLGKGGGRG